jgi:2-amino-4-hydroxy-6-hydroxymethyldihydropteridine diphosphokinase
VTGGRALDPDRAPAQPVAAFVALGSNLGDRAAHLEHALAALAALPATRVVATSSVRETDPVGPPGQGPYLNAVAELRTALAPRALLAALLAVERERGRDRSREVRFGPRTLDLDLLCWGTAVPGGDRLDAPGLTVPHPRMHERAFVLEPLAELAPALAASARATGIHS